jgi:hypothetical protein
MANSNRKARRAAKAVSRAAGKTVATVATSKGKIGWDAKRPLVAKAISFSVAQDTTVRRAGVVGQLERALDMIAKKQATVDHAREFINAIRKGIAAKTGDKYEPAPANKVSEYKKILGLSAFACADKLIVTLNGFDVLTREHLYAIASYMIGARGKKPGWQVSATNAPKREILERVVRKYLNRGDTDTSKRRKPMVVGMPSDPVRGVDHGIKVTKALIKNIGKELSKSDAAQLTGILASFEALKPAARKVIAERNKAAAE